LKLYKQTPIQFMANNHRPSILKYCTVAVSLVLNPFQLFNRKSIQDDQVSG